MDQAPEAMITPDVDSPSYEQPAPGTCSWQSARDVAVCNFEPQHAFLVGIDSDGCVFDTMELKHKECFIPHLIRYYELQGISKFAREVAEFVNLYSKSRGVESLSRADRDPQLAAAGGRK